MILLKPLLRRQARQLAAFNPRRMMIHDEPSSARGAKSLRRGEQQWPLSVAASNSRLAPVRRRRVGRENRRAMDRSDLVSSSASFAVTAAIMVPPRLSPARAVKKISRRGPAMHGPRPAISLPPCRICRRVRRLNPVRGRGRCLAARPGCPFVLGSWAGDGHPCVVLVTTTPGSVCVRIGT